MTILLEMRYHVPRSQVWAGSRGRAHGNVHLHTAEPLTLGRIRRQAGQPLCGKPRGWYERPPDTGEFQREACARCCEIAARIPPNEVVYD